MAGTYLRTLWVCNLRRRVNRNSEIRGTNQLRMEHNLQNFKLKFRIGGSGRMEQKSNHCWRSEFGYILKVSFSFIWWDVILLIFFSPKNRIFRTLIFSSTVSKIFLHKESWGIKHTYSHFFVIYQKAWNYFFKYNNTLITISVEKF